MPTYTVTNFNFELEKKQKEKISKNITKIHNTITGANKYFVQVIFKKIKKDDHFIGGKKVKEPQIFLYGQIRAGRNKVVKKKLILNLCDTLVKNSKLDKSQIWIYIIDLKPSQMIEFGSILPKSGGETEWFKNLSSKLKKKLSKIEA